MEEIIRILAFIGMFSLFILGGKVLDCAAKIDLHKNGGRYYGGHSLTNHLFPIFDYDKKEDAYLEDLRIKKNKYLGFFYGLLIALFSSLGIAAYNGVNI